jgi:hypothetical protein
LEKKNTRAMWEREKKSEKYMRWGESEKIIFFKKVKNIILMKEGMVKGIYYGVYLYKEAKK